jgi:putative transposase
LERRLAELIQRHPTFGYRRLCVMLRRAGMPVNRKAVYRLLQRRGWMVHQREATPRPRAQGRRSRAKASNARWAMDLTHIDCGADGWGHLAVVIDGHDREVIGYEFALRGRAQEAERALEQACHAPEARAYLARRAAEGRTRREAVRALKRFLVRAVWRLWQKCLAAREDPAAGPAVWAA